MRGRLLAAGIAAAATLAVPAAASAATKVVDVGLPVKSQKSFQKVSADVNDFFPHGATIHVGDSIRFTPTGEFHTVNFPARGKRPLPLVTPTGQTISGVNDAAGSPFWFNGQPQLGFNPALFKLLYGKHVKFNPRKGLESGLPVAPKLKPFTVKFSKAGRFVYYCNVHPGMKGVVIVKPKSRRIPSRRSDARSLRAQLSRDLKTAKTLSRTKVPSGVVGIGAHGPGGVEFYGFFPRGTLNIATGTTLTFRMATRSTEDHTATTGPSGGTVPPSGSSYLGQLAASFNSPVPDQRAVYPSDPPGSTPASLTPLLHGNGFWNSGVLDASAATPLASSNSVKFTSPGTYDFYCLIHPFMHIRIVVK